ncbi:hypothetical protein IAR50_001248 [Cryptococcus sp. DSM 104548]
MSDSQLMFLGSECGHPACYLHDFLPFNCPACHQPFCQPHFLPSQHSCTAPLPPSMVDRIAPTCPMCSEIVPFPKSLDPNEAVERHILGGTCTGFQGGEERKKAEVKRRREQGEVCWKKTCGKVLVVKMKCDTCQHVFCPTHRRPNTHTCLNQTPSPGSSSSGLATPQLPVPNANAARPAARSAMSRLLPPSMQSPAGASAKPAPPAKAAPSPKPLVATVQSSEPAMTGGTGQKLDARAAAAAAAMKRAGQDVKVPFVKTTTQKRTRAEIDSQMKALKARHDKGLLTKAEQVKYAELVGEKEASRRSGGSAPGDKGRDSKDCIIA